MPIPKQLARAPRSWLNAWKRRWLELLAPNSLRTRLTVGVAAVSVVSLGSVALWMTWSMQRILVMSHTQNIEYIAQRLPDDVGLYSQSMPTERAIQKAIDNLGAGNTLVWVENHQDRIVAHSQGTGHSMVLSLLSGRIEPDRTTRVFEVGGRYWVLCGGPLISNSMGIGTFYIAQDIDNDRQLFDQLIGSLTLASVLATGAMTLAIALYVRHSLATLQSMGQLAENISVESLSSSQIQLEHAPSEVQDLARTYDKMLARLSMSWEQQRQFVSNVSHELRTPLTIVSGYLQSILRRETNLTEPQRDALTIAASESDRVTQLLQDLLTLARADSGYMHFQIETLDLCEFVNKIAEMARAYSNRTVTVDLNSCDCKVRADESRLTQVLLNLIDNAVKYSAPNQPIALRVLRPGNVACIQICDRGVGIPLPHQERIFERFYRVDEARSRSTGGTGLGLSIVKILVEGMEGDVWVNSKPGEGSTFTVSVPLAA
ncbi:His Kinase A (phosphoacceptor) domain protein/Histidine kinase-like ATPase [Rubidibacter lacunae KORDI 51-2]|uniref:histidine kinase n=1 Tax=Rubidibacter lacunae KORDI 51-2 TaxID=582515 RepID=U5DIV6_9CHRO|nr:ATP-binding protein [Rubidibacter lacunae]ERN40529.1 His Kinase A (phosphoacceptor) domain protein/Histidine kinase-like ATPase [Rubidibacter lacunae KORDI 51-2]